MKIGILLHVYHLETDGWEEIVWGSPLKDELGTATKFVECLLDVPAADEVVSIVYSGPSDKAGLSEGGYTKRYILDRIQQLAEFPRLKQKLDRLSASEYECFIERLNDIVVGPQIKNTLEEMESAAAYFGQEQTDRVFQIAAATHAPRCMRNQAAARYHGLINVRQQWFVAASDVNYTGYSPDDVVIAEPIHRKDNPLYGFKPAWVGVTKPYPYLTLENKKQVLRKIDAIMTETLAKQPESTEMVN